MDIFHLTMNDLTSLAFGLSSPSRFQHRVDQVLYVEMVLRMDSLFVSAPRPGLPPKATSCTPKPLPSRDTASPKTRPTFPMKALGLGSIAPISMASMTCGLPSEEVVVGVTVS